MTTEGSVRDMIYLVESTLDDDCSRYQVACDTQVRATAQKATLLQNKADEVLKDFGHVIEAADLEDTLRHDYDFAITITTLPMLT